MHGLWDWGDVAERRAVARWLAEREEWDEADLEVEVDVREVLRERIVVERLQRMGMV